VLKYIAITDSHTVCEEGLVSTEFYVIMSGSCSVKATLPTMKSARVRG
jgi:hypothetical protein